jgi:hypothetical protein
MERIGDDFIPSRIIYPDQMLGLNYFAHTPFFSKNALRIS